MSSAQVTRTLCKSKKKKKRKGKGKKKESSKNNDGKGHTMCHTYSLCQQSHEFGVHCQLELEHLHDVGVVFEGRAYRQRCEELSDGADVRQTFGKASCHDNEHAGRLELAAFKVLAEVLQRKQRAPAVADLGARRVGQHDVLGRGQVLVLLEVYLALIERRLCLVAGRQHDNVPLGQLVGLVLHPLAVQLPVLLCVRALLFFIFFLLFFTR